MLSSRGPRVPGHPVYVQVVVHAPDTARQAAQLQGGHGGEGEADQPQPPHRAELAAAGEGGGQADLGQGRVVQLGPALGHLSSQAGQESRGQVVTLYCTGVSLKYSADLLYLIDNAKRT